MSAASRTAANRAPEMQQPDIGNFRAQHLALGQRQIETEFGPTNVIVDEGESPLAWLARRRSRDGHVYIEPHQLQAGERLRADFSYANLMPRTTSNWSNPLSSSRSDANGSAAYVTDMTIAARQRVHQALNAAGPEFAGLLLDVCCFLKGLEEIERERIWPAWSAKVVLRLALERLARHYGYATRTSGPAYAQIRTWLGNGGGFRVDDD